MWWSWRAGFVLLAALYWLYKAVTGEKQNEKGNYFRRAAFICLGVLIGVLPATLHNMSNGAAVLISSNFGINFYIGNNPDATGAYRAVLIGAETRYQPLAML